MVGGILIKRINIEVKRKLRTSKFKFNPIQSLIQLEFSIDKPLNSLVDSLVNLEFHVHIFAFSLLHGFIENHLTNDDIKTPSLIMAYE